MPLFTIDYNLPRPVGAVFAFFCIPANLAQLAPPEAGLTLHETPATLVQGSRLIWTARRWGVTQRIVMDVTAYEADARLEQTQSEGPFPRWVQVQTFASIAQGTRVQEAIEFEPPRGMMGRVLTEAAIRADLERGYAYRIEQLAKHLSASV